jgi:SAM-dependent methyltransferase
MLSNRKYKKYPEHAEIDQPVLDPNSSLTKMLELVGMRKKVLDLGCATGYFAKLLTQRECDVVGIDMNPTSVESARAYCTRAIVADLDATPLLTLVEPRSFDAIVCGDVLEHLRYPTRILEDARAALREGGSLIASIPNVAHGAIRLSLLGGSFDYQELGILDDSHLRFFTAKTVDELFLCAGYRVELIERTRLPLFETSDLVPQLIESNYNPDVVDAIRADPECETLQFVVRATPLADDLANRAIAKRFLAVNTELANARTRIERLDAQLGGAVEETGRIEEANIRYEVELAKALSALEVAANDRDLAHKTVDTELANARARIERLDAQLGGAVEETGRIEEANIRYEVELAEALSALEVAANDRDLARKTVDVLRDEVDSTGRLNAGLVAEIQALLERPVVPPAAQAELESAREELERTSRDIASAREEIERERARNEKLTERFVRHVEASISRARSETSEIAEQIDQIQTGRIWRFKNALRRMFRRGERV